MSKYYTISNLDKSLIVDFIKTHGSIDTSKIKKTKIGLKFVDLGKSKWHIEAFMGNVLVVIDFNDTSYRTGYAHGFQSQALLDFIVKQLKGAKFGKKGLLESAYSTLKVEDFLN